MNIIEYLKEEQAQESVYVVYRFLNRRIDCVCRSVVDYVEAMLSLGVEPKELKSFIDESFNKVWKIVDDCIESTGTKSKNSILFQEINEQKEKATNRLAEGFLNG